MPRGRGDGGAPSLAPGRRRSVPSGIGADAGRPRARTEFPGGERLIQRGLARLLDGHDLSREEAREVMGSIMSGEATPAQIAGFLIALRAKGERSEEHTSELQSRVDLV